MQIQTKESSPTSEFDFSQLKSLCYKSNDSSYHEHLETYIYEENFDTVWDAYYFISPEKAWSGKMLHFHRQYCRQSGEEVFPGQSYTAGLDQGQVIILNLHVFAGLIKLQVGHEIVEINKDKKMIKICYLENSKSEGSQYILFKTLPNGSTEVEHKTYYKSGSIFRDKFIYPYFHTKAINEFHGNVRDLIVSKI
ncbi:hypothetical protein LV84_00456 [Algoriphagus ratkowskyi]|uniref:Uncharacterized protein n=1 Tax=Algoriphagus ratkowskyi TaxID=57028 RepID=A0A2W7RMH9_9BACT|nr:hypothetical protein [Algoriphagus ratkowskyi]PZX60186.1 hypothetical protein LV84_00456 [Algoriphagus ratkowskyi]TXD78011.1 hypothetical protein ESW18_08150 [Algoriphagus ratkowskyi]